MRETRQPTRSLSGSGVRPRRWAAVAATVTSLVALGGGSVVAAPPAPSGPGVDGRTTVVAIRLGNPFVILDGPARGTGPLLEVLRGPDGVRAWRLGTVSGPAARRRWRPPAPGADAVLLGDGWWQLTGRPATTDVRPEVATVSALDQALQPATVLDTALGDVDGDGSPDVVAAFRRPHRETEVGRWLRRVSLVDVHGRSAHVGVYRLGSLRQRWVAGSVLRPVSALAACDGSLAVGLTTLEDPTTVTAVGAWRWGGFGFVTLPELAGTGRPACSDVDGDGLLDPVAIGRTPS